MQVNNTIKQKTSVSVIATVFQNMHMISNNEYLKKILLVLKMI